MKGNENNSGNNLDVNIPKLLASKYTTKFGDIEISYLDVSISPNFTIR